MTELKGVVKAVLCILVTALHIDGQPPNIIIIVADDLGWDDVSFHGSEIQTPHLDYLAQNGLILTDYYVNPVCTPTRSSILSGRYPIHTGLQTGVIFGPQPYGLPLNETLLSQYLKKMGYETHAVGKWHLGFFKKEYTPTYRGFDSHYGYWTSHEDYFDHHSLETYFGLDFRRNMDVVSNETGLYSTELFTTEAVSKIHSHNKSQDNLECIFARQEFISEVLYITSLGGLKPFFLYLAHQAVHSGNPSLASLEAPEYYIKRFPNIKNPKRRIFAGMVSALDDSVGNLTKALNETGMINNTIIVFTTDNGGPVNGYDNNAACNWPLRGGKYTLWEGGVRGTGFIYSPLLKRKGQVYDQLMHATDWVPTLYRAAGGDPAHLAQDLDGVDMWQSLNSPGPGKRQEVLLNIDPHANNSAIRVGDYKVIMGDISNGHYDSWYPPLGSAIDSQGRSQTPFHFNCGKKPFNASTNCDALHEPCLYHLASDPCEFNNIANSNPTILKSLLSRLNAYRNSMVPTGNKPTNPYANPVWHGGVWVPWE